ncbi:MAG: hypothetical protein ACYDHG_18355 [Desulfomonilaceae bacterium]
MKRLGNVGIERSSDKRRNELFIEDLLGHKSGRITTDHSMAKIANLISAANAVCEEQSRKSPALVILKKKFRPELVKLLGGTSM